MYNKFHCCCSLAAPRPLESPFGSLDGEEKQHLFHIQSYQIHVFATNEYVGQEFSHGTHLDSKISIGAFDCLSITSTALLGCQCFIINDYS